MKKTEKKLKLSAETVRVLSNTELQSVAGAGKPYTKPAHGPHACVIATTYMTCPR